MKNRATTTTLAVACLLGMGCEWMDPDSYGRDEHAAEARERAEVRERAEANDRAEASDMAEMHDRAEMRDRADVRAREQSTEPGIGTWGSAVGTIARARCDREQRCGNVNADENYSSMDDCVARVQSDWADELNAYECPDGVASDELAECVTEIRNEDCANPFDTLERIAACRSSDICDV